MSARPRASWLRSDNHERFAAAMMKCRHAGAFCAADGICHHSGSCFGETEEERVKVDETTKRLNALEAKFDRLLAMLDPKAKG